MNDSASPDLRGFPLFICQAHKWRFRMLVGYARVSTDGQTLDAQLIADAWADTTTPHGELMITILAGLATFERHLIRARTDEGRKRAQARGVKFGRPMKPN